MLRIKKNLDLLKVLVTCNKNMRKALLQNADKELILTICECILNCLNGNIKLSEKCVEKISKYKKLLRRLLVKKKSIRFKKSPLIQS